ncbi:MAG: type II toxin-antitoxin system Phd/YefM family antitoxin [Solirubrobacteraceae bacterium]
MASTVPQRELRNHIGEVLARAQRGEHMTITVRGHPVAELRPLTHERPFAQPEALREMLARTLPDPEWAEDLRRMRREDEAVTADPWR